MSEHLISQEELKKLLDNNDQEMQLVDVRTLEKRNTFNIGGKHIPTMELPERHDELNPNQLVVTYCTSGGNSMRALQYLLNLGFTNVKSLDGGMNAWLENA